MVTPPDCELHEGRTCFWSMCGHINGWVGGWMNECVEERILQRTSNSWNEGSSLYPLWKGREIKTCNLLYPVGLPREAWQPSKERLSTRNADRLLTDEQEMKRMGEEKRKFHVLLCMLLYHLNLWEYFTWVIIKRKHNGEKRKGACLEDHIFKTLEDFLTLSWPMGNRMRGPIGTFGTILPLNIP